MERGRGRPRERGGERRGGCARRRCPATPAAGARPGTRWDAHAPHRTAFRSPAAPGPAAASATAPAAAAAAPRPAAAARTTSYCGGWAEGPAEGRGEGRGSPKGREEGKAAEPRPASPSPAPHGRTPLTRDAAPPHAERQPGCGGQRGGDGAVPSRPACRWGSGRAGERGGSGRRIGAASPRGRPPASCGQQRQHSNEHGGCAVTSGQPAERGEGAWGGGAKKTRESFVAHPLCDWPSCSVCKREGGAGGLFSKVIGWVYHQSRRTVRFFRAGERIGRLSCQSRVACRNVLRCLALSAVSGGPDSVPLSAGLWAASLAAHTAGRGAGGDGGSGAVLTGYRGVGYPASPRSCSTERCDHL